MKITNTEFFRLCTEWAIAIFVGWETTQALTGVISHPGAAGSVAFMIWMRTLAQD